MKLTAVIIVGVALVVIYLFFLRKLFSDRSCKSLDQLKEEKSQSDLTDELDDSDLQEVINHPSEDIVEKEEQQAEIE